MAKVDPVLVPDGIELVHAITSHCFVDADGQVVFLRRQEGKYVSTTSQTVYDAISQCFHILDGRLGEVVDFYRHQPLIHIEGEIAEMRSIVLEIQKAIAALISPEGASELSAEEMAIAFGQIVQRLGQVRNPYKLAVVVNLNQSQSARGNGFESVGEILAPAAAHFGAVKRFDELRNITKGVIVQAHQLIDIARVGEERIKKVYDILGIYEARVGKIVGEVEQLQRKTNVRCPTDQLALLRRISHDVSHPSANQINALNGVVRVEPFKSRIESAEVKRLAHLDEYLDQWQEGQDSALYTFQRTFAGARSKLKRLVRDRQAAREQRTLDRRYAQTSP